MKELIKVKYIVVHCTATMEGKDFRAADVRKWHKQQGWEDIGYHYVIDLDGLIEEGRNKRYQGAHVAGYNSCSIGVCYVGGLDKGGLPADTRTPEQKHWLKYLLRSLKTRYPKAKIVGHRDLSPDRNGDGVVTADEWLKCCPCFDVQAEYNNKDLWTEEGLLKSEEV